MVIELHVHVRCMFQHPTHLRVIEVLIGKRLIVLVVLLDRVGQRRQGNVQPSFQESQAFIEVLGDQHQASRRKAEGLIQAGNPLRHLGRCGIRHAASFVEAQIIGLEVDELPHPPTFARLLQLRLQAGQVLLGAVPFSEFDAVEVVGARHLSLGLPQNGHEEWRRLQVGGLSRSK